MKKLITASTIFALTFLSFIPVSYAKSVELEKVTIHGREVILNNDGTWKYLSTDRYASTKDGTRIRLKENGSWQAIGNTHLTSNKQVRTSDLDIKLKKVVIESYKKKVQKNISVKTQMVFYVNLNYSPQTKRTIGIKNSDTSLIEIKDNNGKIYPVLSIKPNTAQLQPNTDTTMVIRSEETPSIWNNAKSMEIVFKTGLLGIETPITLSQEIADFHEEDVDGFDKRK